MAVPNRPQTLTHPISTEQWVAQAGINVNLRAGAIATDLASATLAPAESATCSVKWNEPARDGLPETVPSEPIAKPAGSTPAPTIHVKGGVPPDAAGVTGAYATPTSPAWKPALVIASATGLGLGNGD